MIALTRDWRSSTPSAAKPSSPRVVCRLPVGSLSPAARPVAAQTLRCATAMTPSSSSTTRDLAAAATIVLARLIMTNFYQKINYKIWNSTCTVASHMPPTLVKNLNALAPRSGTGSTASASAPMCTSAKTPPRLPTSTRRLAPVSVPETPTAAL